MSDAEQQLEELEVLASIFPDEFRTLDSVLPVPTQWAEQAFGNTFKIELKPSDYETKEWHVKANLVGAMPPNYPTEVPLLVDIQPLKGLGADQVEELLALSERTAAENLGMPSAYTVAMAVQEWLTENNLPGNDGSMYSEMLRREQKKVVEENRVLHKAAIKQAADSERRDTHVDEAELERQRRRQAGRAVTVETFLAWKDAFEKEKQSMRLNVKGADPDDLKPTGKQWFLMQQASGQSVGDDEEERLLADGEKEDFVMEDLEGEDGEEYDEEDDEDYVDEGDEDDEDDEDYEEEPKKGGR